MKKNHEVPLNRDELKYLAEKTGNSVISHYNDGAIIIVTSHLTPPKR